MLTRALEDKYFQHLVEAARGAQQPFVAVVVDPEADCIVAEGINRSRQDPTMHSEVAAIRALAAARPRPVGRGLALLTTAEPCPMCASAIVYAGLQTVRFGISRPELMARGWNEFSLGADAVMADARASCGFDYDLSAYAGAHRGACVGLFGVRGQKMEAGPVPRRAGWPGG